jgi:hypothetical protein
MVLGVRRSVWGVEGREGGGMIDDAGRVGGVTSMGADGDIVQSASLLKFVKSVQAGIGTDGVIGVRQVVLRTPKCPASER